MLDFDRIKSAIIKDPSVVAHYLPNGKREGAEYTCANIFGGHGDSFSINLNTGLWSDFATGESGASLIDLVSKQKDITFKEAAEEIAKLLSEDVTAEIAEERKEKVSKREDILIPSKGGAKPTYVYAGGEQHKIDAIWTYKNEKGYVIAYDARVDKIVDGKLKKDIFPLRFNGDKWITRAMPSPRPLYNLNKIAEDKKETKTIVICEGCKTADAAQYYLPNYIVTTWQGGCKAAKLADWSSIYGRNVIIIPDADKIINPKTNVFFEPNEQPGMRAALEIAKKLFEHRCVVRIVDTSQMGNIKSGWDIADAKESGMHQADLVKFIKDNIYDYKPDIVPVSNSEDVYTEAVYEPENYDKNQYDTTYFECLGVEGKNHYIYTKATGQVIMLSPSSYKKENLINLAPLDWWAASFPQKNGVDWEAAVDWLCRTQERVGVYDKKRIRGRGAWFDDGRPVLHLGTSMYHDGKMLKVDEFNTNYIYEKAPPLAVKLQTVLPKEESSKLIELCRLARWEKLYYGDILAGWIFSAMVCGGLSFRSHLYMIGAAGSGKSWMLENVVKIIMGNIALPVSSKTTEAGIRQALRGDILPVIFDEAEAEKKEDAMRMQSVFDLARQASSESADAIYKGAINGNGGVSYLCRSSFLFASINNSMTKVADMSRTAVIQLMSAPVNKDKREREADNDRFKELERRASMMLTPEYCRCLLTRAIQMIPVIRTSANIISNICAREFGSRRIGDQMGMILAGVWCLRHDDEITAEKARELIQFCAIRNDTEESGDTTIQEERCLDHLFYSEVSYDKGKYPLSVLLSVLIGKTNMNINRRDLETYLSNRGILIRYGTHIVVSRNEKCLPAEIFRNTEWEGNGWKNSLLRLDNVHNNKAVRFSPVLVSGAIEIPINLLTKDS